MKRMLHYGKVALIPLIACLSAQAQNLDNPLPPVNPVATMSDDFTHVTLTWGYPGDTGENGGRVDPDKITYYIFDAFGSYYDPAIAVTKATSHEFDYSAITGQDFVAYQLTAGMDETWYSLPVNSNIVCVGQPCTQPFSESFASGLQTFPWCVGTDSSPYVDTSIDKNDDKTCGTPDGGCLALSSLRADQKFSITSVKIAVSDPAQLQIQMSARGSGCDLSVDVASEGGEFEKTTSVTPTDSWQPLTFTYDRGNPARYVQVRIRADFRDAGAWLQIDDINVADSKSGATGITIADPAGAPTEYYTVDGHRLPYYPSAPGVYISRAGSSAKKIMIR